MYRRIRKNISFFVFFQEQRIFFCKSTSRLISSHWPDVGYVPIVYKSLPRWMKLPLESGAGMRWASLEVRGCMGKCYAKMKVMLELGTGCMLAGTSHAQFCCCSVAQSCPTLWSHGLQHTRLPCPSLSPRVCSNSCPLSQWCHPTISSSVAPCLL